MTPEGSLSFVLPRLAFRFETEFRSKPLVAHRGDLHTVIIEPDARRVRLVWQTALPAHADVLRLDTTSISLLRLLIRCPVRSRLGLDCPRRSRGTGIMSMAAATAPMVIVAGLGARTSIGRTANSFRAAVRAGIAGFGEHPFMVDTAGKRMICFDDAIY